MSNVFSGVNLKTCILRVPSGSIGAYRNDIVWGGFDNIVALETAVKLDKAEMYLLTGATAKITATGYGVVEWNSSHPAVATVSNTGTVTAISQGTTLITAFAGSNEKTCTVTVIAPGNNNHRRHRFQFRN